MKNPWLAWYPGDYINKTRHLTMAQHGAYTLLLWDYYINGPLLANATYLLNICCGRNSQDEQDVLYVIEHFFVEKDGYYHHERADEEIKRRATIRERLRLNGSKGGLAKASHLLEQKPSRALACSQSQSQSQKEESKAKASSAFELPVWVPKEAWGHYEEMRRRIRKPMTDQARIWGVKTLTTLRAQGHDPAAVLEQSVFNSWQGLFEVKNGAKGNDGYKTAAQRRNERSAANIERAFREIEATQNLPGIVRQGTERG